MRKRILALALMLVMCLSLLPTGALAADGDETGTCGKNGDNLTWRRYYDDALGGWKLVISGTGAMQDYSFDTYVFGRKEIDFVEIGSGVTSIGRQAFYRCGMKGITLPDTLTVIELDAFQYCSNLQDITFPDSLTSIEMYAFDHCTNLTDITIPDSVTSMDQHVFSSCSSLKNVTLSSNCASIPSSAFWDDRNLERVVIPEGVTEIGLSAFAGCSKLAPITLPDSLTTIVDSAFDGCRALTEIALPDGLERIGYRAFMDCSGLAAITIPDGVTRIYDETFKGCTALESVALPDSVTGIGHSAFQDCTSLKSVVIPDGVMSIERNTFNGCTALESVAVPESVTSINSSAFLNCSSLKSLTVPEGVTSIEMDTFRGCSALERVTLPESLTYIGERAFSGCSSLPELTIPDSVSDIREYAFAGCSSLKSFKLPNSLTFMMYGMFSKCTGLERISFPNGMTEIGPIIFTDCNALTDVYYHGTQAEWDAIKWYEEGNETALAATLHLEDHDYPDWSETKAPACVEPGEESSTCTICGRVETREIPALGHVPDGDGVVTKPSCTEQGYTTYTCTRCGESYQDDFVDATGHDYGAWTVTIEPSCLWSGEKERVCANDPSHVETRTVYALGHDWSEWEVETPATEESTGLQVRTCARCGETETEVIPQIEHVHDYKAVVTKPTCTQQGYTTHTCRCGDSYTDNYVNPLGHDYKKSSKEATCTAAGHTEQEVCTRCGNVRKQGETIPALGHKTELRNKKDATCTADGYTGDEYCTRCGKTIHKGEKIAAKGHQWSAWSVVKAATVNEGGVEKRTCSVCGESETRNTKSKSALNPFTDVKDGAYYYDAVIWAVTHDPQITDGTSDTTFSPDATCTRGQVVTFLWRAKGCPEPNGSENRFSDVRSGDYFYKAVLWAIEQGVTDGTSDTTFSPNDPCTRGHVVTFLWRSEGCPSAKGGDAFNDVPGDAYYSDAVRWAVSRGITDGTSATTFSPNEACTRGQIVTFLYRDITGARGELAPPTISEEEGIRYCQQVFRSIKRDYSKAVAIMGYYARYRDSEGNIATYVEITYRIGNNTRQWKDTVLYVDGDVIHDPIDYYDKMADRAYGAASLHYMQLSIDVTRAAAKQYPGGIVTRDQF